MSRFRGPAPLQHTILSGTKETGVTLQTLDDKSFDHGIILAQTPPPFLSVPRWEHCTYHELLQFITPKAASMLVQGLQDRLFVPPLIDVGLSSLEDDSKSPTGSRKNHAAKITSEDRCINFLEWGGDRIYRHYRALGRLWADIWMDARTTKRLIFEDISLVDRGTITGVEHLKDGHPRPSVGEREKDLHFAPQFIITSKTADAWHPIFYDVNGTAIVLQTNNGAVRVGSITIEGQSKKTASKALRSLRPEDSWRATEHLSGGGRKMLVEPKSPTDSRKEGPDKSG